MGINLIAPTELKSATLIADTFTSASGASDSTATLTKGLNGLPVSVVLELQSTLGAFLLPRLNDEELGKLNATPGMMIYNREHGVLNIRDNTNNWSVPSGTGTVTSVDVTNSGTGISFSGGPITGSGTITATLSTSLQSLSDLVSQGILIKQSGGLVTRSLETMDASQIVISNADGVSGNPMIGMAATGITPGSYTQADVTVGADGRIYTIASGGGSGGAPADGAYIVNTPSIFLPEAQPLSALSTGVLKNTTTTGVLSIAIPGADYYSLNNPTRILDSGFAVGNFFIGSGAGNLTLTAAEFNTGVGVNALNAISTGIQNTFTGHSSGILVTTGRFNSGFGESVLGSLATIDSCAAFGFNAANALITGGGVTALGANAISATTIATNCFALGRDTVMANSLTNAGVIGYSATISVSNAINIGNGCKIGFGVASPAYNLDIAAISSIAAIKVADTSGTPATPGSGSVFYSVSGVPFSLSSSGTPLQYYIDGNPIFIKNGATSGDNSSFYIGRVIGPASPGSISATRIIGIGNSALQNIQTGSDSVIAIGYHAGDKIVTNQHIVAIGALSYSGPTFGDKVVAIGSGCLSNGTSSINTTVALGFAAGPTSTCATSIILGTLAGSTATTCADSVFVGDNSGNVKGASSGNVFLGTTSGSSDTTGTKTNLTLVGNGTVLTGVPNLTNAGAFGANTLISQDNSINLGSNCNIGINNSEPAYNLDISLINNIVATQLQIGEATPDTPFSGYLTYTYTTVITGATPYALQFGFVGPNQAVTTEVLIRGFDSTFTDFTGGTALATAMRGSGDIALVGTPIYQKHATSTGDFTITANTGAEALILNLTGIAGSDYTWVIVVKYLIS